MKKYMFLFVALLSFGSVASDDNSPKTLFENSNWKFGGFGGPVVKISQLGNGIGTMIGGRGMAIMNNVLTVGGAGYGMVGGSRATVGSNSAQVCMGYGGPGIGVKLFADEIVHVDMFNLFGWGGLRFRDSKTTVTFFALEPEVNVEVNLFRFMRVGAGVSYRFAFVGAEHDVKSTDLFGFGGQLYMQFGWI